MPISTRRHTPYSTCFHKSQFRVPEKNESRIDHIFPMCLHDQAVATSNFLEYEGYVEIWRDKEAKYEYMTYPHAYKIFNVQGVEAKR